MGKERRSQCVIEIRRRVRKLEEILGAWDFVYAEIMELQERVRMLLVDGYKGQWWAATAEPLEGDLHSWWLILHQSVECLSAAWNGCTKGTINDVNWFGALGQIYTILVKFGEEAAKVMDENRKEELTENCPKCGAVVTTLIDSEGDASFLCLCGEKWTVNTKEKYVES